MTRDGSEEREEGLLLPLRTPGPSTRVPHSHSKPKPKPKLNLSLSWTEALTGAGVAKTGGVGLLEVLLGVGVAYTFNPTRLKATLLSSAAPGWVKEAPLWAGACEVVKDPFTTSARSLILEVPRSSSFNLKVREHQ